VHRNRVGKHEAPPVATDPEKRHPPSDIGLGLESLLMSTVRPLGAGEFAPELVAGCGVAAPPEAGTGVEALTGVEAAGGVPSPSSPSAHWDLCCSLPKPSS